jgi:hypothetical protein
LAGYEIEVRVPRRRGWQGGKKSAVVRIWWAAKRVWVRSRIHQGRLEDTDGEKGEQSASLAGSEPLGRLERERKRVGDRESWEFG